MGNTTSSGSDSTPHAITHSKRSTCTTQHSDCVILPCANLTPDVSSSENKQYQSGKTSGLQKMARPACATVHSGQPVGAVQK